MSKQYLTIHTIDNAHPTDIYSLAATPTQTISASGSSNLQIHTTTSPDFPLTQTLSQAHKLGCHHIATSQNGQKAASAGFGGEVKIWSVQEGQWSEEGKIVDGNKAGEIWAIALSEDGQYLASTTYDGRINVWDTLAGRQKIREYETKGLAKPVRAVAFSPGGRLLAAAGDAKVIALYDVSSGEQVANLMGHGAWVMALDWSDTGEYLLSG
ncbi:MAG: hypothetical protein LQ347_004205 [Umbilicaria vellea]|nr:MAG: hypothetical protein LQ347_004205 [Umbilicaria vellea]